MFRTRTPLSLVASYQIPLGLHVLGLPLAFILSQDQTLHCMSFLFIAHSPKLTTLWFISLLGRCYFLISINDLLSYALKTYPFRLRVQKYK